MKYDPAVGGVARLPQNNRQASLAATKSTSFYPRSQPKYTSLLVPKLRHTPHPRSAAPGHSASSFPSSSLGTYVSSEALLRIVKHIITT
ncbi:MAG: hypothetical protein JNK43_03430 [Ignavibacteria bacterium]|nr:hypothetical protein [Ignavibacteria bacterium]